MAGEQVRGRYPLTSIFLLADWQRDHVTRLRVMVVCAKIRVGLVENAEQAIEEIEAWLERYANGVRD